MTDEQVLSTKPHFSNTVLAALTAWKLIALLRNCPKVGTKETINSLNPFWRLGSIPSLSLPYILNLYGGPAPSEPNQKISRLRGAEAPALSSSVNTATLCGVLREQAVPHPSRGLPLLKTFRGNHYPSATTLEHMPYRCGWDSARLRMLYLLLITRGSDLCAVAAGAGAQPTALFWNFLARGEKRAKKGFYTAS